MKYIQAYCTDIGNRRKSNEDSLALIKFDDEEGEALLTVICDGMGGCGCGQQAGRVVIEAFRAWIRKEISRIQDHGTDPPELKADWKHIVEDCNRELVEQGREKGIKMGTTVTAFYFFRGKYYVVHVGDSRGYDISEKDVQQITRDHSFLEEAVRKGTITAAQALYDRRQNLLLQCVGVTDEIEMDFYTGDIQPGHVMVLCTDGFWHRMRKDELRCSLTDRKFEDRQMLHDQLQKLTENVKRRGEPDNISIIAVVPLEGQ